MSEVFVGGDTYGLKYLKNSKAMPFQNKIKMPYFHSIKKALD